MARSQALQLLFQAQATGRLVSDVLAGEFVTSADPSEGDLIVTDGQVDPYARELALGADAMLHELDAVLEAASDNWGVSRMPAVDRNLLRLALYEMLRVDEVDTAVAIDECVELAKAYGTDESSRFVNGLLGKVARRMEAGEDVVATALEQIAERDEAEAADDEYEADELVDEASEYYDDVDDLPDWVRE